ncbi:MAG TPA: hypothetical protein VKB53_00415 [Gammaproteobacteria bacterium]|nr:hypothetical protein [Gammaproteobacteria bacterium]HKH19372.1 hypothetical protein [Gammaproteobacteria bacterium]
MSEEEVINNVKLKETVDAEFTITDDVAEVTMFFASFPTNAPTGQSIVANHGWHMQWRECRAHLAYRTHLTACARRTVWPALQEPQASVRKTR